MAHSYQNIEAGPFDLFAKYGSNKDIFFQMTMYMPIRDLCWAIAIAIPNAQSNILNWILQYDTKLAEDIILTTASDPELSVFFKILFETGFVRKSRVRDRKISAAALKSCNIHMLKWIIENNFVSVDDYLFTHIISQWNICAKKNCTNTRICFQKFYKGHRKSRIAFYSIY